MEINSILPTWWNRNIYIPLTICCKDDDTTATQAHTKPLKLTFTSVTVQTPTPITTTMTDTFTSLE